MTENANVRALDKMYFSGQFEKFIQRIRFPYFKNMEFDAAINFTYPVTAFVGQNGCGKSSVLQALYGAPHGKSIRDFWFSTSVDPIEDVDERKMRQCFTYSYGKSGRTDLLEVIKLRVRKQKNPDYWEPSRPYQKYGMRNLRSQRIDPVSKNVVYLDFRGELSAFDKFFYFGELSKQHKSKTKQDFIRRKSSQLNHLFEDSNKVYISKKVFAQNESSTPISPTVLSAVSSILGRTYSSGIIVRHKLYKGWGVSVRFVTAYRTYSEAYAGSGEMAVVRLVSDVLNAENGSLILLDEPEVSLHPGAQEAMMRFVLEQAKCKKHQVVIATHSPSIVRSLPPSAIKLFRETPNGRFGVLENVIPEQAFFYIGSPVENKKEIVVEDILAKELIDAVASSMDDGFPDLIHVTLRPGGAETIVSKYAPQLSEEDPFRTHIVLDGDQKHPKLAMASLPANQQNSSSLLDHIKKTIGFDVTFFPPGGDNDAKERALVSVIQRFGDYWDSMVDFLPLRTPEELIWSEDLARVELELVIEEKFAEEKFAELIELHDPKGQLFNLTECVYGVASPHYRSMCTKFLRRWINAADENYQEIVALLRRICQ